ncbi:MAG TPA: hypothetical protein VFF72_00190 [Caldimonas sp.]|nr:hypothetical protein [Caldimonas sp.]
MKAAVMAIVVFTLGLSAFDTHAARLTQDPLTRLPLPESTTIPLSPNNEPTAMPTGTVCKSSFQGNHYMLFGKLDAAVAWYRGRLDGFSHLQSADGRMHVFSDPARSVVIIVMGSPGGDASSVAYEVYRPGLAQGTLAGFTQNKMSC